MLLTLLSLGKREKTNPSSCIRLFSIPTESIKCSSFSSHKPRRWSDDISLKFIEWHLELERQDWLQKIWLGVSQDLKVNPFNLELNFVKIAPGKVRFSSADNTGTVSKYNASERENNSFFETIDIFRFTYSFACYVYVWKELQILFYFSFENHSAATIIFNQNNKNNFATMIKSEKSINVKT